MSARRTPSSVIDGHMHLWDVERLPYPWLAPDAPPRPFGDHTPIKKSYRPNDYRVDCGDVRIEACVHVQANCADAAAECAWIAECAARTGLPTAHVAYADLTSPHAAERLEWLAERPLTRGVRMMLNWHDEPVRRAASRFDLMEDPAFRAGFGLLRRHGLSFDLGCLPAQLPMARRLADDHPDVTLVLNHLGWPLLGDPDGLSIWRSGMRALARCPNVQLKVSGLWPIDRNWDAAALRPLVRDAIEWFGFKRSLYGSNLPIEKLMRPLPQQVETLLVLLDDASDEELDDLFRATARRVYRLP
jgi:predicted TIM-barrel fold metal-dependent hydrolase